MGWVNKTPSGSFRANWRDLGGKQKAKTFPTKKEANAYLADVEVSLNRGTYVDPKAGKVRFAVYADRWLESRADEKATMARDASIMRSRVLPEWGAVPVGRIDFTSVQAWVSRLSGTLAPSTVRECHRLLSGVLRSAVRDRVIPENPAQGVKLPPRRRTDAHEHVISPDAFFANLLPAIPERYRALTALTFGTGLRWGEATALRWADVDGSTVRVGRVAVEVGGVVTIKPYPKSRAGRRLIPLPGFVVTSLAQHAEALGDDCSDDEGLIFTNTVGSALLRGHFRARVWRPALVTAGLLGKVVQQSEKVYRASWRDRQGIERHADCGSEPEARTVIVERAQNGLRFHDLRHSYATWLVSRGVPLNEVARVMGHEHISTTLDRYTHSSKDGAKRVRDSFADFPLTEDD